ncbi:hypothetical protein EJB05_52382, partial [Eragrostis curvula]
MAQVWRRWSRGSVQELLDGCPAGGRQPQEVLRCIHVGLLCVQEDPLLRPGMAAVVIMLNSRSITLPAPTAPAYTVVPGPAATAVDAHRRGMDHEGPRKQKGGNNGTIDGHSASWWPKSHNHKNQLNYTRGYLIELMHSDSIFISNLTRVNLPAWNIHPVYRSNIVV